MQNSLAKGFQAASDGLSIPKANAKFQKMQRDTIVSLRTVIKRFSSAIRLETTRGHIDLPVIIGDALERAGYRIVDELGVLQTVTEEPST